MSETPRWGSVFQRWAAAETKVVTPLDYIRLTYSADFYPTSNYLWSDAPTPVDGEVGYDDRSGKRIVVQESLPDC